MSGALKISSYINQRKEERLTVTWNVIGKWRDNSTFEALTVNISKSGIMIASPVRYREGDRAYIKFQAMLAGEKRWIDAVIEIRHQVLSSTGNYNIGASFVKMTTSNKDFIAKYIDKNSGARKKGVGTLAPNQVKHVSEQLTANV